MLYDVEVSITALEAAMATGLPVILGFTCQWGPDRKHVVTRSAELAPGCPPLPLVEALAPVLAAAPRDYPVIAGVMHTDFDVTDAALPLVKSLWEGPIAIYPNSGTYAMPHWQFETVCPPHAFADAAAQWARDGAHIIGGCCGLGPEHIAAACARLRTIRP